MNYIEQYYKWILDNPKKVNNKVKTIYKKLVDNLTTPTTATIYNPNTEENEVHKFVFDKDRAERPIKFIELFCKHSKGKWAGKPVKLELWQKAFIEALYGFIDEETKLRKYKKGVLFVGRKNGKSTLASGLALYMLTKDGEDGAEVYAVATKKDQAKIVWEESKRMIKKSPDLDAVCRCRINGIFYDDTESIFKALASDSDSLDGLNSYCVLADEVHAWKDKNLQDVMYDSMSAREQPMFIEFSTMGKIRENVFDNEYEYDSNVIDGKIIDETILPIIYELDKIEEWQDEEAWYKANPRSWHDKECQGYEGQGATCFKQSNGTCEFVM